MAPNGYDCQFLSEPDDALKCLICLSVARDPRQHEECGKLFCSECIEKYGMYKPCPNCKKTGAHFYKDHRGKRDIAKLKVKCDNVERRCKWVGTVETLEGHMSKCEFTLLPCPKECRNHWLLEQTINHFMRKDLNKHLKEECPNRDYSCKHCGEKGTYTSIIMHDKECPKKPVPCPKGCFVTMQRKRVRNHVATECELTVIACKYKRLGCDREMKRKDMAAHEDNDKLHLRMAMDTTVQLKERIASLEKIKPLHFKLTEYQQRKNENKVAYSPSYYISPNGYRMKIRVDANGCGEGKGTHVSVFAQVVKGDYDDQLKWPFSGTVTFTLLNQLEDEDHYTHTLEVIPESNMRAGSGWGFPHFIPHSALGCDGIKNTQYLKDDTLHFRMSASAEMTDHKPWLE